MKKILAFLLAFSALLCLCACGSAKTASESGFYSGYDYKEGLSAPAAAPMEANYAYSDFNEAAVAEEAYGGFAASAAAGEKEKNEPKESDSQSDINPEKIIYSADATVETTEFDSTLSALSAMIDKFGGWIESSSVSGANYSSISRGTKAFRSADYTIRVPNSCFEELMESLPSLGNVPYSHTYTENITSQYYDTKARLTSYEAQEKRLLELLDEAETVTDVIEIENELAEVRYRIESLQTSLRNWDRRVDWSTLYLNVNEVSEYTPEKVPGYGERLSNAFSNGFEALGDFFVGLVEVLPVLIVAAVILLALIRLIVWAFRRRPKKKAARKAKKAAEKALNPEIPTSDIPAEEKKE